MGMYTGFRAKVLVREEYSQAIEELHDNSGDKFGWDNVKSKFPNLELWKEYSRYRFIPFGNPFYLPDEWTLFGEKNSYYDRESRMWEFSCSLKNYEGEIDFFIVHMLLLSVDIVAYCQSLYEEDAEPTDLMEIHGFEFIKQDNNLWVRGEKIMKKEDDNYLKEILDVCISFHGYHVDNEGYSTDVGKHFGSAYRAAIELYMSVSARVHPDKKTTKEDVLLLIEKGVSFK